MKRIAVLVVLMALALPLTATPALAVAPDNDAYEGRVEITELPFAAELDTSEATTDDDDVEINAGCAPATDASVWYELTLAADATLVIDVAASDYTAGIIVATGSPDSFSQVACGPEQVVFDALAGEPYAILVFDDQVDGGGNGGILRITTEDVPPPPTIDLEIDPNGTINPRTDVATVSVTIVCSEPALVEISMNATQAIGRHNVIGDGFTSGDCGPDPTSLTAEITGFTSFFNPGAITVVADAFACTVLCGQSQAEAQVRLRPAPGEPAPEPEPEPEPVSNDEMESAIAIGLDETLGQDTTGATPSDTDPTECPSEPVPPSEHTVWYAFTAPSGGFFEVDTAGSDYDTVAFVLAEDGSVVGCDDDIVPGVDQVSQAIFEATAGASYLIMIGSFDGSPGGTLVVTVTTADGPPPPPPPPPSDPPANDERGAAIGLAVGDATGPLDTTGATPDPDDPSPECAPASHTVWYTVTPADDGWVEVTTFGSDYDTVVLVLAGEEHVACNDDGMDLQSRAVFFAEGGVTYEIMVGSFGGSAGGVLELAVASTEPPLTVELTDLRATVAARTGIVTLHATISCSEEATAEMFAFADQQNGRFGVSGQGDAFLESCTPDGTAVQLEIIGNEAFRPGSAFVFVDVFAQSESESATTNVGQELRLRPANAS